MFTSYSYYYSFKGPGAAATVVIATVNEIAVVMIEGEMLLKAMTVGAI